MKRPSWSVVAAGALSWIAGCAPARGPEARDVVLAAVAANFVPVHERIAAEFERTSGIRVETTSGSTGKLCAQIENGAPFEVFLAADAEHPARLEQNGHAVPETHFLYALGELVLYVHDGDAGGDPRAYLRAAAFERFAIANPETAPYGRAARQLLERMELWDALQKKLVRGESIAQAFEFVDTGAADAGLVARSQMIEAGREPDWIVPAGEHDPLAQHAVLLTEDPAARAFLEFLRSDWARDRIEAAGYGRLP